MDLRYSMILPGGDLLAKVRDFDTAMAVARSVHRVLVVEEYTFFGGAGQYAWEVEEFGRNIVMVMDRNDEDGIAMLVANRSQRLNDYLPGRSHH